MYTQRGGLTITGYYGSSTGGFYGKGSTPAQKDSPSAGGLLANLLGDIRGAAVGLPEGVVQLAKHPERSLETGAKATWQDWSPLFHGHVGEWAHNTYSHPLAPLLDVATVFTGGTSAAARIGAKLGELGAIDEGSTLAKLGEMTKPATRGLHDPLATEESAARPVMQKQLSTTPAVRLRQIATHTLGKHLNPYLPQWFTDHIVGPTASYERAYSKFLSSRGAANSEIQGRLMKAGVGHADIAQALNKMTAEQAANAPEWANAAHMQIAAAMHAGKSLSEIDTAKIVQPMLLKYNHENLVRHGIPHPGGPNFDSRTIKLPDKYAYVAATHSVEQHLKYKPGTTFEQQMDNFGRNFTTQNVMHAATKDGVPLMVPTKAAYKLGVEGANSVRFLKQLWRAPSAIWKKALIHYSPRTIVDNSVGNWTMLAMRQSGHGLLPGIVDTVKQLKGQRAAKQMLGVAGLGGHWTDTHFLDELNAGFAHSMTTAPEDMGKIEKAMQSTKAGRVASQGFIPFVHTLADQPVRRTALNAFMRTAPEVKALRRSGMGFDPAVAKALETTPGLQGRAASHIRSIAGDYTGLTPTEQAIRSVVPFYTWSRHIATHTAALVGEHPGRIAAMQQVSNQGVADTEKRLGELPSFLQGLLPLGGAGKDGRVPAIGTQGLNPYASMPDIADAVGALVGKGKLGAGSTLGNQLNPLLTGLVEQLSGTKLGSTEPVATHGGVIPSILANTAEGLPYARLVGELLGHGEGATYSSKGKTQQHLYAGKPSEIVSQLLGAPRKLVSVSAAKRLAQTEQTQMNPKPKKKKALKGYY
jgi:hypothetical protein